MSASTIPEELLRLIRHFEGLRLRAYKDSVGVWTVGYGHTGPEVRPGLVITEQQAEELLRADAAAAMDATIQLCPIMAEVLPGKLIAIADFVFNLGAGRLRASTLRKLINSGDWEQVPTELRKWIWARNEDSGEMEKLEGLIKRREAECALWENSTHAVRSTG